MEPEARFTAIGAILLLLLAAAAAATVWLTRSGPRSEYRYYTIYFERQSLHGLQLGGDVEMRGVQVGRVERFSIARDNIKRVQVTIRIDARTPVGTNTVAVVSRKILTSVARIDLVTTGDPGPELAQAPAGERYPVIAEAAEKTATQASATLRDFSRAAAALERASDVSVNELRATAQELRSSAEVIARTADRLDDPRAVIFGPNPAQLGPGEKLR